MAGLNELKERIKRDSAFASEVSKIKTVDGLLEFASERGYVITDEEIEELTSVSGEEIARVSGGVSIYGGLAILVTGNRL